MIDRFPSVSFEALGTTAIVVCGDAAADPSVAARVVRSELDDIDRTCSRFRPDSDLMRVNAAAGSWVDVDPLLVDAVNVALRAARLTGGLVDLTVGGAMLRIGYDRDFAEIEASEVSRGPAPLEIAAPGWWLVETSDDPPAVKVAPGTHIDLGSTAKAVAADRSAVRAAAETGTGVLVGLGGDIAVAGVAPDSGWPIGIAEDHAAAPEPGETISIASGGVATSSTTVRRWSRGEGSMHHIVDPRSGRPANGPWRTVSVCAATCVDANIASTASIVAGDEAAPWLERQGLPARLIGDDGTILRLCGWPRGSFS